ncbi:unnamed protein product [Caenorhabditis nigoni]
MKVQRRALQNSEKALTFAEHEEALQDIATISPGRGFPKRSSSPTMSSLLTIACLKAILLHASAEIQPCSKDDYAMIKPMKMSDCSSTNGTIRFQLPSLANCEHREVTQVCRCAVKMEIMNQTMAQHPAFKCRIEVFKRCTSSTFWIPEYAEDYNRTDIPEDEDSSAVEKFKKYVRKINKSPVVRDLFKELQKEENIPQRMLKKDCEVRWSSMYFMLASFLENKRSVSMLRLDHPKLGLPEISEKEWEWSEYLYAILKPVAETTKDLQSRFGASIAVIIPSVTVMNFKFLQMKQDTKSADRLEMLKIFLENFNERTSSYLDNDLLKTASFLDPRFKEAYFKDAHKNAIINILKKNETVEPENAEIHVEPQPSKSLSLFDQFLMQNMPQPEEVPSDVFTSEIEEYLKTPPNPTIDPYEFWSGQKNLPMLKRLAVEYIAIPATSSESERLFSLSGLICSPKRSNLTSEKLDQLTFCSMNLKLLGINSVSDF